MMKKRENGYYWVKLRSGGWTVALYAPEFDEWFLLDSEGIFITHDFSEIDERRIEHEEPVKKLGELGL